MLCFIYDGFKGLTTKKTFNPQKTGVLDILNVCFQEKFKDLQNIYLILTTLVPSLTPLNL